MAGDIAQKEHNIYYCYVLAVPYLYSMSFHSVHFSTFIWEKIDLGQEYLF